MSYFYKIKPVDNWTQMYHKYRGYVLNRVRELPEEDRKDLYSELWFFLQNAKKSYKEGVGMNPESWFFWYLKTNVYRLLERFRKKYIKEISIDSLEKNDEAYINFLIEDKYSSRELTNEDFENTKFSFIDALNPERKYIIENFYGVNGKKEKSIKKIAKDLNITLNKCYSQRRKALRDLNRYITSNNKKYKTVGDYLDYEA